MTELETAFVGLFILLGAGAILYAGIGAPARSAQAQEDGGAPPVFPLDPDSAQSAPPASGGGDDA